MTVQRDVRLRAAQRQEVEQKIKAVEEWNKSSSRKGETSGVYSYGQLKKVLKEMPNPGLQVMRSAVHVLLPYCMERERCGLTTRYAAQRGSSPFADAL